MISGVASQSINDCFSATYDFYRVVTELKGSTNQSVVLCFRVAGADNTTSNYRWAQQRIDVSGGSDTQYGNGTSQMNLTQTTTNFYGAHDLTIYYPFKTEITAVSGTGTTLRSNYTAVAQAALGGVFDSSTSFTGFSLIGSGGNITGIVSVYGYNK
jgi:hypothetical protein